MTSVPEIGGSYWILASLTDGHVAIPNDISAYAEKTGYLPVTLQAIEGVKQDRGLFTLDWNSRVEIQCALSETMSRSWPEDEMCMPEQLEELKETNLASIIHTLGLRFGHSAYLTRIGGGDNSVYLWVNPMRSEIVRNGSGLFRGGGNGAQDAAEVVSFMQKTLHGEKEHSSRFIYSMMESVRQTILSQRTNETIIFRGVSGSGKTEAIKSAIQYLLFAENIANGDNPNQNIADFKRMSKKTRQSGDAADRYVNMGTAAHGFLVDNDTNSADNPSKSPAIIINQKIVTGLLIFEYFLSSGSESAESCSRCIKQLKLLYRTGDATKNPIYGLEMSASLVDTTRLSASGSHSCYYIISMMMAGMSSHDLSNFSITLGMKDAYIKSNSQHRSESELKRDFEAFERALERTGCNEELFKQIMRSLACICHLQSITITGSDSAQLSSSSLIHVKAVEKLLGTPPEKIRDYILKNDAGRLGIIDHKPADSRVMILSLSLGIYNRVIYWLSAITCDSPIVEDPIQPRSMSLKEPMSTDTQFVQFIDVLGFESMEIGNAGGIYSLSKNYCNERFGYQFVEIAFGTVIQGYAKDGVVLPNFASPDITSYTDLFDKLQTGVASIIEDVTKSMRPEDKNILDKLIAAHSKSKMIRMAGHKGKRTEFVVQHSFGTCAYDAVGFAQANLFPSTCSRKKTQLGVLMNSMENIQSLTSSGLATLLSESSSITRVPTPEIAEAETGKPKPGRIASSTKLDPREFLFTHAKDTLTRILATFEGSSNSSNTGPKPSSGTDNTKIRYVTCLKPNQNKQSYKFDGEYMIHQVKYSLIPALVSLHKNTLYSYSYRLEDFYQRYSPVFFISDPDVPPISDIGSKVDHFCRLLLDKYINEAVELKLVESFEEAGSKFGLTYVANTDNSACRSSAMFGLTKVYFRSELSQILNSVLSQKERIFRVHAIRLQAFYRCKRDHYSFKEKRSNTKKISAIVRGRQQLIRYRRMKRSADKMRANVLMKKQRRYFLSLKNAVNVIKRLLLGADFFRVRTKYLNLRRKVEYLHFLAKGRLLQRRTLSVLENMKKLQRMAFRFLFRCRWYYKKLAAAITISRLARGSIVRGNLAPFIAAMKQRTKQRIAIKTATILQWRFRSRRISKKFALLKNATMYIQRWIRARLIRLRYSKLCHYTIWAQSNARRICAMNRVSFIYARKMLYHEQASLSVIRSKELAMAYMHVNEDKQEKNSFVKLGSGLLNDEISLYKRYCVGFDVGASSVATSFPKGLLKVLVDFNQRHAKEGPFTATAGNKKKETQTSRSLTPHSPSKSPLQHTLSKLKKNYNLKTIVGGENYIIFIDDSYNLYGFGAGDGGQLGDGNYRSHDTPILLESLMSTLRSDQLFHTKKTGASTGSTRSPVRSFDGGIVNVYSHASDGVGASNSSHTSSLKSLTSNVNANVIIRDICCGHEHTLILSESGMLWSWGSNWRGQLGHSDFTSCNHPILVKFKSAKFRQPNQVTAGNFGDQVTSGNSFNNSGTHSNDVKSNWRPNNNTRSISCGAYHCACINADGYIYTWGASECLGKSVSFEPKNSNTQMKTKGKNSNDTSSPEVVQYFAKSSTFGGQKLFVSEVCCGDQHVHCFASPTLNNSTLSKGTAHLFAWGINKNGQLGIGDMKCKLQYEPTRVAAFPPVDLQAVLNHRYDSRSKLKSNYENNQKRKLYEGSIKNMPPSLQISSKGGHVLVLNCGKLWAWGCNRNGQIGNSSLIDVYSPIQIRIPAEIGNGKSSGTANVNIRSVSAGRRHSSITCENGEVFAWGMPCINQYFELDESENDTEAEIDATEQKEESMQNIRTPTKVTLTSGDVPQNEMFAISTDCISNSCFTILTIDTFEENNTTASSPIKVVSPKSKEVRSPLSKKSTRVGIHHLSSRSAESVEFGTQASASSVHFGISPNSRENRKLVIRDSNHSKSRYEMGFDPSKVTGGNATKWDIGSRSPLPASYHPLSMSEKAQNLKKTSFIADHDEVKAQFRKQLGSGINLSGLGGVPTKSNTSTGDNEGTLAIEDLESCLEDKEHEDEHNAERSVSTQRQRLPGKGSIKPLPREDDADAKSAKALQRNLTVDGLLGYFLQTQSTEKEEVDDDFDSVNYDDADDLSDETENTAAGAGTGTAWDQGNFHSAEGVSAPIDPKVGRRSSLTGEFKTKEMTTPRKTPSPNKMKMKNISSRSYEQDLRMEMSAQKKSYSSYFSENQLSSSTYELSSPTRSNKKGPSMSKVRDLHRQIANIKFDTE